MTELFEEDIEHELRLPWVTICRLAVKARCAGQDIEALLIEALEEYVARSNLALTDLADLASFYGFKANIRLEPQP